MITLSMHPVLFLLIIVAIFGALALIVFILRKHIPSLRDDDIKKPETEEQAAKESLDRILVPIEDEKKENKDENKDNEKEDK